MRDAILCRYELKEGTEDDYVKVEVSPVIFHQFGVNCEEREGNFSSYSTAIIEMPDGMLDNVPVELIKFIPKDIVFQ